MSSVKTIINRAQNYSTIIKAQEIISAEAYKGASDELANTPILLEPKYVDYPNWSQVNQNFYISNTYQNYSEIKRYNCCISLEYENQWFRSERFLKTLSNVKYWVGFEIIGNSTQISFRFLVNQKDEEVFKNAFRGELLNCSIYETKIESYRGNVFFYDFFPTTPYHYLQTEPKELQITPYESFIRAINELPDTEIGFVQVIFQPCENNWQQNIERLADIEFLAKTIIDPYSPSRAIQPPSSELKNISHKIEAKAHNDKPLFFTAIRSGIITSKTNFNAWPFASFIGLIQQGKRPFNFLTDKDYQQKIKSENIQYMFEYGLTYRPGFLTNSSELTSLVHLPSISEFAQSEMPIEELEKLQLTQKFTLTESGLSIGQGWMNDKRVSISLDEITRGKSIHIIGKPGSGKTTLIENMILQDIENNRGLIFLDPHGDSINRLLELIPADKVDSTIYLNFGDPNWIPLWNPLYSISTENIGRTTNDLVASIKNFVQANSWGDRLETILSNCFFALLHLDNSNFFDLLILLEHRLTKNSSRKQNLLNNILDVLEDKVVRLFWTRDYPNYRREDFAPPRHKLSKLLTSNSTISTMLTQSENRINFGEIIENNKFLLIDLSNLGSGAKSIVGSFLLALLHATFLSRNNVKAGQRELFSIYCDEAHKFTPDGLEEMLTESRKFGVNLILAHQYLNQFSSSQKDALSSTGTTIIFNTDLTDAHYLIKGLQDKVTVKDIITLEVGEAIAKINNQIVKINTNQPKSIRDTGLSKRIIDQSHKHYYSPKNNFRNNAPKNNIYSPENTPLSGENLTFDEFK